MKGFFRLAAGGALALFLTALAGAQAPDVRAPVAPSAVPSEPQDSAVERERIRREREAIDQALQRTQVTCYQRFAVEDCLRAARRQARKEQAVLRQQESMMDDRERRERAAQRLQSIEERQGARTADAPLGVAPRASHPQKSPAALPRALPAASKPDTARASPEQRRQALQQRAAVERQRQTEKQQAAQERKARVQQREEQDAARGRQPAAALVP